MSYLTQNISPYECAFVTGRNPSCIMLHLSQYAYDVYVQDNEQYNDMLMRYVTTILWQYSLF